MNLPSVQLSGRQRQLLGVTGSALLLIFIARFLFLPVMARVNDRRATLRDLRVKIVDASRFEKELPHQQEEWQQVRERYQLLEDRIGSGQSVARILEVLSQQAKERHVGLAAVQSKVQESAASLVALGSDVKLREVPLRLTLIGRYRQIGEFLGWLPQAPFLASVWQIKLTRPLPGDLQVRAELVLAIYLAGSDELPHP